MQQTGINEECKMENCLTDAELREVVLAGPERLYRHSDEKPHVHIVHEGCGNCAQKLIKLILLSIIPVSAGD
jgi:hypothetical protein